MLVRVYIEWPRVALTVEILHYLSPTALLEISMMFCYTFTKSSQENWLLFLMGQAKVAYLLYWILAAETQLRRAQVDRSNDMNFYLQIDTTWYEITRGIGLPLQIPKQRIMVFIYASWILVGVDLSGSLPSSILVELPDDGSLLPIYLFLEKILHFQFHWILIKRLMMWRSRHWYTFCFLTRPYRGKTEEISWEVPPLINTLFRGSTLLGKTEEITWESTDSYFQLTGQKSSLIYAKLHKYGLGSI